MFPCRWFLFINKSWIALDAESKAEVFHIYLFNKGDSRHFITLSNHDTRGISPYLLSIPSIASSCSFSSSLLYITATFSVLSLSNAFPSFHSTFIPSLLPSTSSHFTFIFYSYVLILLDTLHFSPHYKFST